MEKVYVSFYYSFPQNIKTFFTKNPQNNLKIKHKQYFCVSYGWKSTKENCVENENNINKYHSKMFAITELF